MAKLSATYPVSPNIYNTCSTAPSTPHARPDPAGGTNLGKAWCHHYLLPNRRALYTSVGYTSALLQPSQLYTCQPLCSPPLQQLLQLCSCSTSTILTISIWSAKLPDKAHTKGTFLRLLCWGGTRPDSLSKCRSLPLVSK